MSIALTNGLTDTPASQDESTTSLALVDFATTEAPATTTTVADDLSDEDLALACGEEGLEEGRLSVEIEPDG